MKGDIEESKGKCNGRDAEENEKRKKKEVRKRREKECK